jgi:hypothetical protein
MPQVKLNESRIMNTGEVRHAGDEVTVSGDEAQRLVANGQGELVRAAGTGGKGRRGTERADA